jgi:RNA polymerase sigma-70 factor (ECF subfamily)
MASANPTTAADTPLPAGLDPDSAAWLGVLTGSGPHREAGLARLHDLLLRIAMTETRRRSPSHRIAGPELDDLAYQAAADALLAITGKLDQFRGESRFTTWAYKFVIFEVSAKLGRHFWRTPGVRLDTQDWEQLPDRLGFEPARQAEWQELLTAVRMAVEEELTPRQRRVFVAIAVAGIPLDALVAELGSTRGAIYKTMFDARRKLRAALVANGYLDHDTGRRPMNGRSELDRFLQTDPSDVGCDEAMRMLNVYVDLLARDAMAAHRYPGIAAHLHACGPCSQDFHGLLAAVTSAANATAQQRNQAGPRS